MENRLTVSRSGQVTLRDAQEFIVHLRPSVSASNSSGTMTVFSSQIMDKVVYTTQNEEFISNTTDNDYIVI